MRFDGERLAAAHLVGGYQQALARFRQAAAGREPEPAFYALFETLNWAVAVDDLVVQIWCPEGVPEGYAWRSRVPGGDVMDGVRFVRNLVHHQWADALVLEEGLSDPLRSPLRAFAWKWRTGDQLPAPQRKRDHERAAVYEAVLAGRHAEGTLLSLDDAFSWLARLLEPRRAQADLLATHSHVTDVAHEGCSP